MVCREMTIQTVCSGINVKNARETHLGRDALENHIVWVVIVGRIGGVIVTVIVAIGFSCSAHLPPLRARGGGGVLEEPLHVRCARVDGGAVYAGAARVAGSRCHHDPRTGGCGNGGGVHYHGRKAVGNCVNEAALERGEGPVDGRLDDLLQLGGRGLRHRRRSGDGRYWT